MFVYVYCPGDCLLFNKQRKIKKTIDKLNKAYYNITVKRNRKAKAKGEKNEKVYYVGIR